MATLYTNPQIAKFCDEVVRPLADDVTRLNLAVQHVLAVAASQGIIATLQSVTDQTQVINDGSQNDGRSPIKIDQLLSFLNECKKAHDALETTTAVQQALAIQVNGFPR